MTPRHTVRPRGHTYPGRYRSAVELGTQQLPLGHALASGTPPGHSRGHRERPRRRHAADHTGHGAVGPVVPELSAPTERRAEPAALRRDPLIAPTHESPGSHPLVIALVT